MQPATERRDEKEIDELNRAVTWFGQVVASTSDTKKYTESLNNLGVALQRRYEQTGSMEDLERAIEVLSQATELTSEEHPDYAVIANNLGSGLDSYFEQTGSIEVLDDAISIMERAVRLTPDDHSDRAGRVCNLGFSLQAAEPF